MNGLRVNSFRERMVIISLASLFLVGFQVAQAKTNWDDLAAEAVEEMDASNLENALRNGADPDASASLWSSLLQMAISLPAMQDNPARYANRHETEEIVKVLLEHGASVDPSDSSSSSALELASMNGMVEIVRILLDYGAQVDRQKVSASGSSSPTPLMHAAARGYEEVVRLLLRHGADPSITFKGSGSSQSTTALEIAREGGHSSIVRMLQEAKDQ